MISRLKMLIIVNWDEQGSWPLLLGLKGVVRRIDVRGPFLTDCRWIGWVNSASVYLAEFYGPLITLFRRARYDVVISWQMRIGICYGLLKRLFHYKRRPIHIIQDFHIDLSHTGCFYRIKVGLLKLAVPGIDYFFCTSSEEEEIYSRMFGIPRERIVFLPLVEAPQTFAEPLHPREDYVFAFGLSDRDYDTLVRAVASLPFHTCILSSKYRPAEALPENVQWIRHRVSRSEMIRLIASSRIVVLPLKDYRVSAGQISMLEVMALARPLIVTENMATKEYALHKQTVLFFQAGKDRELAGHIRYLWEHPEEAEGMGKRAKQAAAGLVDRRFGVLRAVLDRCAVDVQKGVAS